MTEHLKPEKLQINDSTNWKGMVNIRCHLFARFWHIDCNWVCCYNTTETFDQAFLPIWVSQGDCWKYSEKRFTITIYTNIQKQKSYLSGHWDGPLSKWNTRNRQGRGLWGHLRDSSDKKNQISNLCHVHIKCKVQKRNVACLLALTAPFCSHGTKHPE